MLPKPLKILANISLSLLCAEGLISNAAGGNLEKPDVAWGDSDNLANINDDEILIIDVIPQLNSKEKKRIAREAAIACEKIGRYLILNRGLWGTGPFSDWACDAGKKLNFSKKNHWILSIKSSNQTISFDVSYRNVDEDVVRSSVSYSLDSDLGMLGTVGDDRFAPLIASLISFKMPFSSRLNFGSLNDAEATKLSIFCDQELALSDANVTIFTSKFKNGIWQINSLGKGKFIHRGCETVMMMSDQNTKVGWNESKAGVVHLRQIDREKIIFDIDAVLKRRLDEAKRDLFTSFKSGYAGIRFGVPFGGGTGVFARASQLGILSEFRGGILEGLRFYFEQVPLVKNNEEGLTETFFWRRVQTGYSYGWALTSNVVNWVDLSPKIGVSTLRYQFTKNRPFDIPLDYKFEVKNAGSLGLDIGLERRTLQSTARLSTYGNYAVKLGSLGAMNQISTLRLAADYFYDLSSKANISPIIIAFASSESETFKRTASSGQHESFSYRVLRGGIGLAVSW